MIQYFKTDPARFSNIEDMEHKNKIALKKENVDNQHPFTDMMVDVLF